MPIHLVPPETTGLEPVRCLVCAEVIDLKDGADAVYTADRHARQRDCCCPPKESRPMPTITSIPLDQLRESYTNPRRFYDAEKLTELAESIRAVGGVRVPILVRPIVNGIFDQLEIVNGHRRFRASKMAGLTKILAETRELSDVETIEEQLLDNSQREDVHPLGEAEAYQQLLGAGRTVDEIAAKICKGPAHVRQRLRFLGLFDPARASFYGGRLSPAVALLLARIQPEELQAKALKEIEAETLEEQLVTVARATTLIRDRFTLRMDQAPFDPKDKELVPAAGSCGTCPKRTANRLELFADFGRDDLCTDPDCFAAKKLASFEAYAAAATAKGMRAMPAAEARKVLAHGIINGAKYVELSAPVEGGAGVHTWKDVLGKGVTITVARDPTTSKERRFVERSVAMEALEAKDPKLAKRIERQRSGSTEAATQAAEHTRRKNAERVEALVFGAALESILVEWESGEHDELAVLQLLATALLSDPQDRGVARTLERREITKGALEGLLAKMPREELSGLVLELVLSNRAIHSYGGADDRSRKVLKSACEATGVDLKKIEKKVREDLKAAESGASAESGVAS